MRGVTPTDASYSLLLAILFILLNLFYLFILSIILFIYFIYYLFQSTVVIDYTLTTDT